MFDAFLLEPGDAEPGDAYFSNVSLLLPLTGINNSTVVTDFSQYHHTVTTNDNAKIITSVNDPFDKASGILYCDGTGDYLNITFHESLVSRNLDATIEMWFRPDELLNSSSGQKALIGMWSETRPGALWLLDYYAGNLRYITDSGSGSTSTLVTKTTNLTAGTWYYIAAGRSGNNMYIQIGTSKVTATAASMSSYTGTSFNIARKTTAVPAYAKGWFSNIRITKGVARDISSIPVVPFSNF